MLERFVQRLRSFAQTVLNPLDEDTIARNIRLFEMYMGLRPFRLVYPPDADAEPRLHWSRVGCVCLVGHATMLMLSLVAVLVLNPVNAMSISNDPLARSECNITAWLRVLNTLLIFWQIFWRRDSELVAARLQRSVQEHLRSVGVDVRPMCRRAARVSLAGLTFVVVSVVTIYVHSVIFLWRTVAEADRPYLPLFSIATAMTSLYIQLVFVQFCMMVSFQRIRVEEMNRLMVAVFEWERAAANRAEADGRQKRKQLGWY